MGEAGETEETSQHLNGEYSQSGKRRVLLVGRHALTREGLHRLLERDVSLEVVAEAGSAEEAIHAVQQCQPDLALIDMSLPTGFGIEVVQAMRKHYPSTGVVALLLKGDEAYRGRLQDMGASVVLYWGDGHELLTALHTCCFDKPSRKQ